MTEPITSKAPGVELLIKGVIERTDAEVIQWVLDTVGNYTFALPSATLELDGETLTIYNSDALPVLSLRDQHSLALSVDRAHKARALEVITQLLAEVGIESE